jgi:predicted short-subunit dehydrogenase-like oxidoreductase (DUF2520 family)
LDHIPPSRALALVGPGRAGTSLALALQRRGWSVRAVAGRSPDAASTRRASALLGAPAVPVETAGAESGTVVIATPDHAIAGSAVAVAGSLPPGALVVHLSGAAGLRVFDGLRASRPDVRLGALHPLQSLPTPELGAERLLGAWCAVEGPADVAGLAESAGLRPFTLPSDPDARVVYHAAACVASNHLVALLAQVERLAASTGVPFEAFLPLVRTTVENVAELGPPAALTGPVARGDTATVAAHLSALPEAERDAYRAGASEALRLTGHDDPELEALVQRVLA